MLRAFLSALPKLFGPGLATWATQFHAVALSFLAAAWLFPPLAYVLRRIANSEGEIEWIKLWRCPKCSNFNRRSFTSCMHCQYSLKLGVWGKWISHGVAEKFKHGGRRLVFYYGLFGWLLMYGITFSAFFKLRLLSFHQNPVQELTASLMMICLLASLLFFYLAFRPRSKSPVSFFMDTVAGMAALGAASFLALVWVEAPLQPNQPLAYLHTTSQRQLQVRKTNQERLQINLPNVGNSLQFDAQYTVLSWPLMGIRHLTVTHLAGVRIAPSWWLFLSDHLSSSLQDEGVVRPRFVPFSQTFVAPPDASFTLLEAQNGLGLVLQKQ